MTINATLFQEVQESRKPVRVLVPDPPIGNKSTCLTERGIFVLEEGACLFRAMACTHAGSGGVIIYDGTPNADGFFPEAQAGPHLQTQSGQMVSPHDWNRLKAQCPLPPKAGSELFDEDGNEYTNNEVDELVRQYLVYLGSRNGRVIYYAHPACMGMWMLDAGCFHGLTFVSNGPMEGNAPFVTITWMKHKARG